MACADGAMSLSPSETLLLARKIREQQNRIAILVTDTFLSSRPDWVARYGERARTSGIEDAMFHLDFLAAAVETCSTAAFTDYARWTGRVLQARGISTHFLAENFEQIEAALSRGLSGAEQQVVAPYLAAGRAACLEPFHAIPPADADGRHAAERRLFLGAILGGQRKAATGIAREVLRTGDAIEDVYVDVVQSALYEVGRRWEANQITVADEHMATAVAQYVIGQLYEQIEWAKSKRGRLVIAGVAGEFHQLGANMIADVLEARGWDVRFLGTNVPLSGILAAVERHDADVVGLSITMLTNVARLREVVDALRRSRTTSQTRIVVGGAAFRSVTTLWQDVGADLFIPDLRAAFRMLAQYERKSP
jgi:methanogenic corrinoid protein MtbC1